MGALLEDDCIKKSGGKEDSPAGLHSVCNFDVRRERGPHLSVGNVWLFNGLSGIRQSIKLRSTTI